MVPTDSFVDFSKDVVSLFFLEASQIWLVVSFFVKDVVDHDKPGCDIFGSSSLTGVFWQFSSHEVFCQCLHLTFDFVALDHIDFHLAIDHWLRLDFYWEFFWIVGLHSRS